MSLKVDNFITHFNSTDQEVNYDGKTYLFSDLKLSKDENQSTLSIRLAGISSVAFFKRPTSIPIAYRDENNVLQLNESEATKFGFMDFTL